MGFQSENISAGSKKNPPDVVRKFPLLNEELSEFCGYLITRINRWDVIVRNIYQTWF